MSRRMKHNKYSDFIILNEIENYKKGEHETMQEAHIKSAEILGARLNQTSSRFNTLVQNGVTIEDLQDYTEEDMKDFNPGDGIPIRQPNPRGAYNHQGTRGSFGIEQLENLEDKKKESFLITSETVSESECIKQAILVLLKDKPAYFIFEVIAEISSLKRQ